MITKSRLTVSFIVVFESSTDTVPPNAGVGRGGQAGVDASPCPTLSIVTHLLTRVRLFIVKTFLSGCLAPSDPELCTSL